MNAWRSQLSFRRAVTWLVTLALLLPTLTGCVTASPPVIRLDGIVVDAQRRVAEGEAGWVRVVRDGAAIDGHAGMELFTGDRVETGPRAEAVIRFPSGSEVLMRPNSGGRIGSFTDIVGEVFIKVKGIFSADTTFVKAGARGTQYLVHESPGGTTYVVVFEGSVLIESTRGSWAPVTMQPGDATFAYPQAPQPHRASAEELRRTQDWVERLERTVPPQTTVSTTGVLVGVGIAAAVAAILSSGGGGGGGGGRPQRPGDTGPRDSVPRESDRRSTPSTVPERPPASAGPSTTSVPGTAAIPPRAAPTGVPSGGSTPTGRTAPTATPSSSYTPPTPTHTPAPAPAGRTATGSTTAPSRTVPAGTTTTATPKASPAATVPAVRSRAATSTVVRQPTLSASSAGTPIR